MNLAEINFFDAQEADFWGHVSLEKPKAIVTLNAEMWQVLKNNKKEKILKKAEVVVADGVGLVLGYRLITGLRPFKVSGVDLISSLIINKPEIPVFLWGAEQEVVKVAAKKYRNQGLNVVGFHNGYDEEYLKILQKIKNSGAKLCLLGMSGIKQLETLVELRSRLNISTMTCGGSFDIAAGRLKRAPRLFQATGLEWLWRMMVEPKRFKRLPVLISFVGGVVREKLFL